MPNIDKTINDNIRTEYEALSGKGQGDAHENGKGQGDAHENGKGTKADILRQC